MNKVKKLLTLDQLVKFCSENNFNKFSSKDTGYTLSVQVPGCLSFSEVEDDSLLFVRVKVCHTDLNRNSSYISEENMKKAMPTLKYKPLLASIIKNEETGELDFNGHDMEIIESENGEFEINYIEKQVGAFTSDEPYLEYDKENDKTYVIATAAIPRDYTETASIIERKNGTKVSCELQIDSMSYNVKEKYLELEDFIFTGVACLGEHVGEGMLGSRADIVDFSTENNSIKFEEDSHLIQIIQELKESLDNYTKAFNAENTAGKEDTALKLVEEMEVTENEEVVVEETAATEEEVTVEMEEATAEEEVTEVEAEAETDEPSEEAVVENDEPKEDSVEFTVTHNGESKTFSVSLNDKLAAMYNLISETYSELDNEWYDINMYDEEKYVEMYGYFTGRNYRQSYKVKNDNYTLIGDRVEVYKKYMTQDEINTLESLKANYAELEQYKASKEAEEAHAERMSVLADYSTIETTDEFKALVENIDSYSVEEISEKADAIVGKYARQGMQFSFEEKKSTAKKIGIVNKEPKNPKSYAGLFD